MNPSARTEPARYRFPRPDYRSVLLGLRAPQVAILGVAVIAAVAALSAIPSIAGLLTASVLLGLAVPAAAARVRGRTLDQWVPPLIGWGAPWPTARRRWRSSLPRRGAVSGEPRPADPPPPLAGLVLLRASGTATRREVAVAKDRKTGTWTAAVACRGRALALLDPDEQARLLSQWGDTLAAYAQEGSPVRRIGWVVRSFPDDPEALRRFCDDHATMAEDHPARRAYAEVLAAATTSRRHDVYVTLTIGGDRARRAIRQAGGGDRGACRVLLREVDTLAQRLAQADIEVEEILAPHRLAAVLREAFDPAATRTLARWQAAHPIDNEDGGERGRPHGADAWPLATEAGWDHYRSDSAVHATWWVADWPRRDVNAGFLQPLLLRGDGRSAMAVVMEPIPSSRAARVAESARASHLADEELRAKVGYLPTARRRKEEEALAAREAELASGHGDFRFSGYVTLTAPDRDALQHAASEIEEAGFDSGVELRRLYGEADQAFTTTLPLGRGLGDRRAAGRPAHRATTATICSLYPFAGAPGLGHDAPYIGVELYGGAFCYDPWVLYRRGHLTNPNVLVAGKVGRGKSALVKSLLLRSGVFGRRAAVLDPKGEYAALAGELGAEPIRLRPGGDVRLNPLDPGPGAAQLGPDEIARRRLSLLSSVTVAALRRDLQPLERAALQVALTAASDGRAIPTLPLVVEALLEPSASAGADIRASAQVLAKAGHDVALELRRLCEGDLKGMFDGPTTVDVDWDGPLVTVDFSQLLDDDGLGILMACASAWIQAAVMRPGAGARWLVLDEAWRLLGHLGTARWLRASLKLARQYGVANVLVMHRLSDLLAAGDAGSEQVALAKGLLSDTETRIVYAQPDGELAATAELLGLGDTERATLGSLPRGVGLWKVGPTSHVVAHHLGAAEAAVVDTDTGMNQSPQCQAA
jgi:hypothetical protein